VALILAVDPDAVQEQALQTLARLLDDHELVTADSCEEGLAAIDCRTPDLLLVPLLLPEADETALLTRLRERSKRRNVRVLTTPLLKSGDASSSSSSSRFGWRRSSDDSEGGDRCEPAAFAQMIREYLVASGDEAKIEEERRKRRDAAVMAAAGAAASWIRARRATWTDAPLAVSRSRSARGGAAASFETVRGEHVAAASEPEMPVVSGLASSLAPVAPAPSRTPAAAAGEYAPIPRALDPDDEWSADQPAADPPPAEPEAPAESRLAKIARWAKPLSARVLRKPTQTTAGVLLLVMGTVGCAYLLKPRGAAPSARVKIETPAEVYASGLGAPPIEVPRKGQLRIESSPVGAQVLIDGKLRGVTPLTLADVAPGKHTVLLQSTAGSVSKQVSVSISKSTVVSETIYPGWVAVLSPFEIAVSEDGRPIRLDDRFQALLPPGPHDLRIEGRSTGFDEIRHVDVTPGDTIRLTVAAPQSRLSVTASAPADVLVDGANVGATPLSNAPIEVGTRDIVVRGAAGERRFTLPVTTRPLTLDVDFSKP
jgi:hypothetical protein